MIKLILLTGFLGAGKTTLMKKLLNCYGNIKTGVIINEFGEINIDVKLVSKEGVQMAELSNGSIFCACIKDKFVDSLIEMSTKDLDYVFIEASGLADPANMVQILDGIKGYLTHQYDYRGSVCILDGENFLDLYELLPAISSQLEYCSAVIINKTDLIDEERLKEILKVIDELNEAAYVFTTSYCKVDVLELVENMHENDRTARKTSNTYETRPTTLNLKGLKTLPYDKLRLFLEEIAGDTYRIKGFAETDKGNIEISATGKNIYLNPWEERLEKTEIVVISSIGFRMMSVLVKAIEKHLKGYIRV